MTADVLDIWTSQDKEEGESVTFYKDQTVSIKNELKGTEFNLTWTQESANSRLIFGTAKSKIVTPFFSGSIEITELKLNAVLDIKSKSVEVNGKYSYSQNILNKQKIIKDEIFSKKYISTT